MTTTEIFYQKSCESFLYGSGNSLFTAKDSIWTYNCPCPSSRHGDDTRHICRFKEEAASSIICSQSVNQLLQEEFDRLSHLFSRQPPTERVIVVVEEEKPIAVKYTTYSEFMDFMAEKEIVVRTRQCYYTDGCHTKDCTFGHSIEEMVDLFKDERVCQFYREATLKKTLYTPTNKNKEMTHSDLPKAKCRATKCIKSDTTLNLRLILYTGYDSYLIAPYLSLKCPNCLRTQNMPIYK